MVMHTLKVLVVGAVLTAAAFPIAAHAQEKTKRLSYVPIITIYDSYGTLKASAHDMPTTRENCAAGIRRQVATAERSPYGEVLGPNSLYAHDTNEIVIFTCVTLDAYRSKAYLDHLPDPISDEQLASWDAFPEIAVEPPTVTTAWAYQVTYSARASDKDYQKGGIPAQGYHFSSKEECEAFVTENYISDHLRKGYALIGNDTVRWHYDRENWEQTTWTCVSREVSSW